MNWLTLFPNTNSNLPTERFILPTKTALFLSQSDKDDNESGTQFDDVLYGNGGDDSLHGKDGDDILCGGKGNDNLDGRQRPGRLHLE